MHARATFDPRRRSRRSIRIALIAAALGAIAGGAYLIGRRLTPQTEGPTRPLSEFLDAVERDEPGAVALAEEAVHRRWPRSRQTLQEMLSHRSWKVRAAACRILADRTPHEFLSVLLPLCSDRDWRVRAAAFDALSQISPFPPAASLRDTPLDRREQMLLEWMDAYDAGSAGALGAELCELYAETSQAEFGVPLVTRCMACHTGSSPSPLSAADACARCHGQIHEQWKNSAHAQSLSHLQLRTVNPASRQVEDFDFGKIRGVSCLECHRRDPSSPPPATLPASRPSRCPHTFDRTAPPAGSCLRCHSTTHRQWETWKKGRQPRRADWPPGQLDLEFRGDTRTCTDCHMPPAPGEDARKLPGHSWNARRDVKLLREGINVQVHRLDAPDGSPVVRLTLTNLSAHRYPTGTRRRALRVYAGPLGTDRLPLIATLSPVRPGAVFSGTSPALKPGEQRTFLVKLTSDVPVVEYRLVYVRNRFVRGGYEVEIVSGTGPLGGPPVSAER